MRLSCAWVMVASGAAVVAAGCDRAGPVKGNQVASNQAASSKAGAAAQPATQPTSTQSAPPTATPASPANQSASTPPAPLTKQGSTATAKSADAFSFKHLAKDATDRIGYYAPKRCTLSAERPASVTKVPEGLGSALYGTLTPGSTVILIDEHEGQPPRFFVDTNDNGNLIDDPALDVKSRAYGENKAFMQWTTDLVVSLGRDGDTPRELGTLGCYRFDPKDPQRADLKNVLLYYRDYAREGEVKLGEDTFPALLLDEDSAGVYSGAGAERVVLALDVTHDGTFGSKGEIFPVDKPFNIKGTTYEVRDIAADGSSLRVVVSDQKVEEVTIPSDHSVGSPITAFDATLMDGKNVKFPADYKGKVVMLDFWATWCGPCMAEVPGLVKVYDEFKSRGFEVLGVSLDYKNAETKMKNVMSTKGMTWPQVYDGNDWKAAVAQTYGISSIPAPFLVDGDTGKVLARDRSLRGESLRKTVDEALKKKGK